MARMINVKVGNNVNRQSKIVSSDTTLKEVLEMAGVDYTRGMTTLDGATLQPGDIYKTFDDFGISEDCSLLNVVKADNAADTGITVVGHAAVITFGVPFSTLKLLKKYNPESLSLYEGEGDDRHVAFVVDTEDDGTGSIGKYGAVFAPAPADKDKAQITMAIGHLAEGQKVEDAISDEIGRAVLMLKKLEAGIPAAKQAVEAEKAAIAACITLA